MALDEMDRRIKEDKLKWEKYSYIKYIMKNFQ